MIRGGWWGKLPTVYGIRAVAASRRLLIRSGRLGFVLDAWGELLCLGDISPQWRPDLVGQIGELSVGLLEQLLASLLCFHGGPPTLTPAQGWSIGDEVGEVVAQALVVDGGCGSEVLNGCFGPHEAAPPRSAQLAKRLTLLRVSGICAFGEAAHQLPAVAAALPVVGLGIHPQERVTLSDQLGPDKRGGKGRSRNGNRRSGPGGSGGGPGASASLVRSWGWRAWA